MDIRDRILENTTKLFMKRGIKALTMDEIATENGVSKRTLYELFEDKSDLIEACILHGNTAHKCKMNELERESENVLEFFIKMYEMQSELMISRGMNFFGDIKRYYPQVYNRTLNSIKQKRLAMINDTLERGQRQGVFVSYINRDLVAVVLSELFIASDFTDTLHGYEYSIKDILWNTVILYIRGIATEKGRLIIDNFIEGQKD